MRFNKSIAIILSALFAFSTGGCSEIASLFNNDGYVDPNEKVLVPEEIQGMVGSVARIYTGEAADVATYGVCYGLGKNGSSEVPPSLLPNLVKSLKGREGIGSARLGFDNVSVKRFLQDRDTAIVIASTVIPPGAPKGTYLDAVIRPAERTQTKNLGGGYLLNCDLSPTFGKSHIHPKRFVKSIASAQGTILVNPLIDPTDPKNAYQLLSGRILGGVVTTRDMPIHLRLFQSSYSLSNKISKYINQRFNPDGRNRAVSVAKNDSLIIITVPRKYKDNYVHFLKLIEHIPLMGARASHIRITKRNIKMLENPKYNAESLCLTLEAIGMPAASILQQKLDSKNPRVSYYIAKTIMRITDSAEADRILLANAKDSRSPYQLDAIRELGYHRNCLGSNNVLEELLDDDNDKIRIAAYESLVRRGTSTKIRRLRIDAVEKRPAMIVDVVDTTGEFMIYATQSALPKIVLFGKDMPIAKETFFCSDGGVLTLNNKYGSVGKDRLDRIRKELDEVNKQLKPYLEIEKAKKLASSNSSKKTDLENTKPENKTPDLIDDDNFGIDVDDSNELSDIQIKCLKDKKLRCEHLLATLQTRHLEIYRKVTPTRLSRKFKIDFKVLELIYVLGEKPRLNALTGKVEGLGFNYCQVLRTLYLLSSGKNKFIPARFVLQELYETQKIDKKAPTEGRSDL